LYLINCKIKYTILLKFKNLKEIIIFNKFNFTNNFHDFRVQCANARLLKLYSKKMLYKLSKILNKTKVFIDNFNINHENILHLKNMIIQKQFYIKYLTISHILNEESKILFKRYIIRLYK